MELQTEPGADGDDGLPYHWYCSVAFRYQNVYGLAMVFQPLYRNSFIFSTQIRNGNGIKILKMERNQSFFVYIDDVVDATIQWIGKWKSERRNFNGWEPVWQQMY